jgi:co-chaperonin GroES (HSP10)
LRPSVEGLCQGGLALAPCDCQSRHNHKSRGGSREIPSAPRPRRGQTHRCRRQDRWRHHHSGYRQGKPSQGEVVAVGSGSRDESGKLIPIDIQVGDRVLFGKWSGSEVRLDGQELLIMKESDIMGVLTDLPATKKKAA